MSIRDVRVQEFEQGLKRVFDRIDAELEARYGRKYSLHPARPRWGSTGNPQMDGLFNIGAAFTAGFGSARGPGYVVDVRITTLDPIPSDVQESIELEVVDLLRKWLPEAFPGRNLRVERDGHGFKIVGDLSIGTL